MSNDNVEQTYDVFEWINESYLQKILDHHEKTPVKIQTFNVKHATTKGENFVGALFRASVEYSIANENKTISLIIKAKPDNSDKVNEILEEYNIFKRETQAYEAILPACAEMLRTINDDTIIGAKLIYLDDSAIVLEDLAVKGYKLRDVKKRLGLDECKAVLAKVAKFHACTTVLNTKKPDLLNYHRQGIIGEKFTPYHLVYTNTIRSCIRSIKSVPELQQYVEKIDRFGEGIIPRIISVYKTDSTANSFNTLNQGDLWVNNLLFNSENDVLLVDYQEGFFGSPGIDLNWFIYTSCNQHVLSNQLDELKQFYHKILIETLSSLSYTGPIPTIDNINNEINRKADHGLATLLCMVPILIIENKELADARLILSDDEESENARDIIFSNPKYHQLLIDNLPKFVASGHL